MKAWFLHKIWWSLGKGNLLVIGRDWIASVLESITSREDTIINLHQKVILTLYQVIEGWHGVRPTWKEEPYGMVFVLLGKRNHTLVCRDNMLSIGMTMSPHLKELACVEVREVIPLHGRCL